MLALLFDHMYQNEGKLPQITFEGPIRADQSIDTMRSTSQHILFLE